MSSQTSPDTTLSRPVPVAVDQEQAISTGRSRPRETEVAPERRKSGQWFARITSSRWWIEVVVIGWLAWAYDAITNLAPLRQQAALRHARGVLHLEQSLHLDPERTLNRWLSGHHTLGLVISDYYDNAHFVVTFGLLALLWWRRRDLYGPLRNSLVLINVLGFVIFWRYPVAPPRMLTGEGFSDVVSATHAFGSWHSGQLAGDANQFAAMPSLHLAWASWCTLLLWRMTTRLWIRVLAISYPCLTAVAVLTTGNHFLADVLAGLATTAVATLLVHVAEIAWRSTVARGRRAAPVGAGD
jgi:hypothetical protein